MRISPALKKIREKQTLFLVKKEEMTNKMKGMRDTNIMDRMTKDELKEKAMQLLSAIQVVISNEEQKMKGNHIIDLDSQLGVSLALPIVVKALENAYKLGKLENE